MLEDGAVKSPPSPQLCNACALFAYVRSAILTDERSLHFQLRRDKLRHWLPDVLQDVSTWMSEHDIDAGARWSRSLSRMLQETNIGIICLTPKSQASPWVIFEAGALSKSVGKAKVVPVLIAMSPADVQAPLSQFQSVATDRNGVLKLVETIMKRVIAA